MLSGAVHPTTKAAATVTLLERSRPDHERLSESVASALIGSAGGADAHVVGTGEPGPVSTAWRVRGKARAPVSTAKCTRYVVCISFRLQLRAIDSAVPVSSGQIGQIAPRVELLAGCDRARVSSFAPVASTSSSSAWRPRPASRSWHLQLALQQRPHAPPVARRMTNPVRNPSWKGCLARRASGRVGMEPSSPRSASTNIQPRQASPCSLGLHTWDRLQPLRKYRLPSYELR